jgi:hypothetical protein
MSNHCAIGGLGGSGTRTVIEIFQNLGFHIGDDINEASDNLWFTLLFKRRSVLFESDIDFFNLYNAFERRMNGFDADISSKTHIMALASKDRIQHDRAWLRERVTSFLSPASRRIKNQLWAWKEPNTHIIIDRLLKLDPKLRYIHVVRDARYMVNSKNFNQLINWGPLFLDNDEPVSPNSALAYWCAVHRRILKLKQQFPDRIAFLNYDALCQNPVQVIEPLLKKYAYNFDIETVKKSCRSIEPSKSVKPEWDQLITNQADKDWAEQFFDTY